MIRLAVWMTALLLSGASAAGQAESRPIFRLKGRVVGPPSALRGAIAEFVLADGTAASAPVGDDGVFEIPTVLPPDGGVVRVSGPHAATARFATPDGYPAASIDLGERAMFSPELLRQGRPPSEAWTGAPGIVVDVYDAAGGSLLDERRRLTTLFPDDQGRIHWRTLAEDLVVAVARLSASPGRVLEARFFGGDDRGAFARWGTPQDAVPIRLCAELAGAEFAGRLTLPLFLPGTAEAYRLFVRGRFDEVRNGTEQSGAFTLPAGVLFEGRGFGAPGGSPTVYRLRLVAGDATGVPVATPPASLRFDVRDAADETVLSVRPSFPNGILHETYDGLIEVVLGAEPDYEPIRVLTGPASDGSPRPAKLVARSILKGGVAGLTDPASNLLFWRRTPESPAAMLAPVQTDGAFGPAPFPAGPGEVFVRGPKAAARPEPLPSGTPKETVFVQVTAAPTAELRGRILAEGKPKAEVLIRLLPWPEDAALLSEWALPPAWRSAAAKARLDDARAVLAFTGLDGAFHFPRLDPGPRLLIAEAAGRAPFLSPPIELHASLSADYSLDATRAAPNFIPSDDAITSVRRPYGPERTLFGTESLDVGTGFRTEQVRSTPSASPPAGRGILISARRSGGKPESTTVLLHAVPLNVTSTLTPVTARIRLDGEPLFVPFRGDGQVVVRAVSSAFPWTTFGPFPLVDAAKPGAPVPIEPGPPPALFARCWMPEGTPARDLLVRIEPEADRVMIGALPPPIFGRTDENGVLIAPDRPAGRAWLFVEGASARLHRLIDGAPADNLADLSLEPADLPHPPSLDADFFDAEGRRIAPLEVARRMRDRLWSAAAFGVGGARADGPVGAERPFLADPRPGESGRPLVLALTGYRAAAAIRLVATIEGEADPSQDRLFAFADAQGEAYFPAVPSGDYLAVFAGVDGERTTPFRRNDGDPLRVVLPPRETARAAVAVFDGAGQRRLPGAVARIRPLALFGAGLTAFAAEESAVVARDGRAEFTLEAGVRYVLDVVCDEPPTAARTLFGPFAAGVPAADLELRSALSARVRILVRGKESPTTPIPGTVVLLFVAGLPYAVGRTNAAGEASFKDVPSNEPVVVAVAADGYSPGLKTTRFFGGGGENVVDLELEFARTALVLTPEGEQAPFRLEPESADRFLDPRGFLPVFGAPPARLRPDRTGRFAISLGSSPQSLKVPTPDASDEVRTFPLRPGELRTEKLP